MDDEIPAWAQRCPTGKIKYASAKDARDAIRGRGHGKSKTSFKGTARTYQCWRCDWFHIASGRSDRGAGRENYSEGRPRSHDGK